jgi:ABC-type transport system substrate-binding protein
LEEIIEMNMNKKILTALIIMALTASLIAPLTAVNAQEHIGLFGVTIIAPGNANLLRRQWCQIFASNLRELGIDAKVVYLSTASVTDRVFTPAADVVGKTFDQGGFDIEAIGWTPGLLPEPRQLFYSDFAAPAGQNYYLWNNLQSDSLLNTFITSTNDTEKQDVLTQWQQLYYNEMPASQIMYQQAPAVVNPAISNLYTPPSGGEGWLYFNAQPYPQLLTRSDGSTQIVYCATGAFDALNPPESNWWYDTIIETPIFGGLAMVWPTLSGLSDLETPDLLTSWSHSADSFSWTFNCRQGVTWHDGTPFTADDIVFSMWALMGGAPDSQFSGYYQSVYGDKCTFTYSNGTSVTLGTGDRIGSITATDTYTVMANLPVLANGKPYGYFEPYILSFANNIMPKHIFEKIDPTQWASSPFNTGQGSIKINGITYTGPVGTGPYMWDSYNPESQTVHLVKNDNYWNATALEAAGLFQIKDYYIRSIADKTSALAALKNGEVDMLDPNYSMQTDVPSIDPSWGRVIILDGFGRQEFGYNMRHPIFGTGVDTPLGRSDPTKAAEAARDIRIAFDYAIPRQLIINNLLAGYGVAGATPMLPTQPFYDNAITARPYDLSQAKHYLELAGYSPPAISGAGIVNVPGFLNDTSGARKPNATVTLMQTADNSTFPTSLEAVAHGTTDINGFFSFTVSPSAAGTYYYYVMDDETGTYTYLQSYAVGGGLSLSLTWILVIAVIVIVVIIAVVVLAMRKRKK